MTQRLSVVIPVFGNETTLVELKDRLSTALQKTDDIDFELIFVDDASPDNSWKVIETMAATDPNVVGVRLASNVGQLRASCAGVDIAGGNVFVSIDADLEHPPEAVPSLVRAFREGHDLVVARRKGYGSDPVRVLGTLTVNFLSRVLRLPVSDVGSSFLVCTPHVAAEMRRVVEHTGRQMLLPTVFEAASNPTAVDVELSTEATSAYALRRVVELGGEFLVAELGPVIARRVLLGSGLVLILGIHAPWRKWALGFSASMAGLALVGLLMPSAFRRNPAEPLYEVAEQVGGGLGSDSGRARSTGC